MRKGTSQVLQIFAVMFFVLLLVFAVLLLTLQTDELDSGRPQLAEDLANHHVEAMLVSILRQPAAGGAVADLIILDQKGSGDPASYAGPHDAQIAKAIDDAFTAQKIPYSIMIIYPTGDTFIIENYNVLAALQTGRSIQYHGKSTLYLPGTGDNIEIRAEVLKYEELEEATKPVTEVLKLSTMRRMGSRDAPTSPAEDAENAGEADATPSKPCPSPDEIRFATESACPGDSAEAKRCREDMIITSGWRRCLE
jgi:hypothetical protein